MAKKIRAPLLVAGIAVALLAAAFAGGGVTLLEADGDKDDHGYIATDSHEFRSSGAALVSDNLDADLDGGEWIVDSGIAGDVRLQVDPDGDQPIFVGIAPTDDARRYLRNVDQTIVEDVDYDPFEATYRKIPGDRRAKPPATSDIWSATATGEGEQTLEWEIEDGDWSVVVMNADGSKGITADVKAGAKLPWLATAGWGSLGIAAALGGGALALLLAAFRRRPDGSAPRPEAAATATA